MSWKPSRSSGIMFAKTHDKAEKYRLLFFNEIDNLSFESLKKASKYLYYWLSNENKICIKKRTVANSVDRLYYETLKRNENILFPKLLTIFD
jgi:hypothetical protein